MTNPFQVVRDFEAAVAEYAGSKYAVATDSCTSAIFLSLIYQKQSASIRHGAVSIPKRTYPSVPCAVVNAGLKIKWNDEDWKGIYWLHTAWVVDGAKRFRRGMYEPCSLHCLSFHSKKILPIGRGGMILTDSVDAVEVLKLMRYDGREECPLSKQQSFDIIGWNCYMTPEQAARGLLLLSMAKDDNPDQVEEPQYPDLSIQPAYKPYTVWE